MYLRTQRSRHYYTQALQYVKRQTLAFPEPVEYIGLVAKQKNPHAVALGRIGGKKSGPARMVKLTPERRREIARKAVLARWAREKAKKKPNGS